MRRHPFYAAFGLLVLAGVALAEWRGWALTRPTRSQVVPRSVRENPGAYRPVYRGPYRYLRGK